MLEWIARYWIEVIFSLALAGLAWGGKRLIKFYIDDVKRTLEELEKRILAKVEARDNLQDERLNEMRAGLLSMQGAYFKKKCQKLLEPEHKIDVEELTNITRDHDAYKGLGGNHEGNMLFKLVLEKAKRDIT